MLRSMVFRSSPCPNRRQVFAWQLAAWRSLRHGGVEGVIRVNQFFENVGWVESARPTNANLSRVMVGLADSTHRY